mmetsp:Transcript_39948/g.66741  ORF Transcript_39948/g.66741 Transcript_39948/m.66741 type:complete len:229 (+) Transcript_39948:464-1150(+)
MCCKKRKGGSFGASVSEGLPTVEYLFCTASWVFDRTSKNIMRSVFGHTCVKLGVMQNPENKLDLGSRTIDGTKHQVLMNTRYLNPYRLEDFKVLKDNIKEMQQFTKLSVSNLVDSIVELRNLDPLAHDQLEMYADEESTKKLVDAWKTQPMISDDGDSSFDRPDTPRSSACETSYSGASSGALSDHEDSKLQQVEFSVNALKRDFVLLNQDIKEIFALLNKSKKSRRR